MASLIWAIGLALALCAGAGLFAGAMKAAQSPAFYAGMGHMLVRIFVDAVLPEILKRKPLELEAAWRDEKKTGGDTFKRQGGR